MTPSLNRRSFLTLGSALLAAAVTGCGRSGIKMERLASDAVILAFGDSLTFGTGAATDKSYPAQLEKLVSRKVVAAGVPGEVSAAGLARLPSVLEQVQPKLVILCHGGNDFLRQLGEAQAASNIRAMIKLARQHGAAVVLIGVPKPGLFPSQASIYTDIAGEFSIPVDNATLKSILTDNGLKSDLIHPNAAGYARLAQTVADLLRNAGAI
jgi:acyl-CoA thioesterase-1